MVTRAPAPLGSTAKLMVVILDNNCTPGALQAMFVEATDDPCGHPEPLNPRGGSPAGALLEVVAGELGVQQDQRPRVDGESLVVAIGVDRPQSPS
jgi:hypothetical protein